MTMLYNLKKYTLKYQKSYVTHKDIGTIYDRIYKTHSSSKSSGFLESFKTIFSFIDAKENMKVLEIGCGDGIFSQMIPDSSKYLGIDISNKMINEALNKNKNNRKTFSFEKVDALEFVKYSSINTYDLIILSFSQKYFDGDFQAKLLKLLRKNGSLILIDDFNSNFANLFTLFEEFKSNNKSNFIKLNKFNNYYENTDEINQKLISTGYSQTIFLKFEKTVQHQLPFLNDSGIIPELVSEFGNAAELYNKKFIDFLNRKNYILPKQKYYICIAKK